MHHSATVTTPRTSILETLCRHDQLTRPQISEMTNIPLPSVHRLCSQLETEHFLVTAGTKQDGHGRPIRLTSFNAHRQAVLSIDVRGSIINGAVMSLNRKILHEESQTYQTDADDRMQSANCIHHVVQLAGRLRSWCRSRNIPCTGVGVGVPGIVSDTGVVTDASELKWNSVPLKSILQESLGDTVLIENNANASAFGESIAGAGQGKDPVLGYTMRHFGVGAGVICEGRILRGSHGTAGELGYTMTSRASLKKYYPYGGDLEWEISQIKGDQLLTDVKLRNRLFDLVALSLANACLVVDPGIIVMDISNELPSDELIAGVHKRLIGRIPNLADIVLTKLGYQAPIIGVGELISEIIRKQIFNV